MKGPEAPAEFPKPAGTGEEFDVLHGQMLDQLSALYCVAKTIEGTEWESSEELSAALSLLEKTHKALTELYDGFAYWAGAALEKPKARARSRAPLQEESPS